MRDTAASLGEIIVEAASRNCKCPELDPLRASNGKRLYYDLSKNQVADFGFWHHFKTILTK